MYANGKTKLSIVCKITVIVTQKFIENSITSLTAILGVSISYLTNSDNDNISQGVKLHQLH